MLKSYPGVLSENQELLRQLEDKVTQTPADPEVRILVARLREEAEDRVTLIRAQVALAKHFDATLRYQDLKDSLGAVSNDFHVLGFPQSVEARLLLAGAYNLLGENEAALLEANKTLEHLAGHYAPKLEAATLNVLAYVHDDLGLFQEALEYALKGLDLLKREGLDAPQPGNEITGLLLNNIGNIYNHLKANGQALEFYQQALACTQQGSLHLYEGTLLNNIGLLYADKGEYETAIDHYKRAVGYSGAVKDSYMLTIEHNNCGRSYLYLGEYTRALECFEEATHWLSHHPNSDSEAITALNMGETYLRQKHYQKAQHYLQMGLEISLHHKLSRRSLRAYELLCNLYEKQGQFERALEFHKRFHKLNVDMLEQAASIRTKAMMVKFETEQVKKEQELYRLKNIELAAAMRQLEQLSHQDGLTGLFNRRFFDGRLSDVYSRQKSPLSLMLADIDNFKRINDTFSHAVGDEVLKIVASIFMNSLRGSDLVARYGGEEIVAFFEDTTLAQAKMVCEKIRHKIEVYPWYQLRAGLTVTISVGLASRDTAANPQTLLAQADTNLYKAKRNGKNRVEF